MKAETRAVVLRVLHVGDYDIERPNGAHGGVLARLVTLALQDLRLAQEVAAGDRDELAGIDPWEALAAIIGRLEAGLECAVDMAAEASAEAAE